MKRKTKIKHMQSNKKQKNPFNTIPQLKLDEFEIVNEPDGKGKYRIVLRKKKKDPAEADWQRHYRKEAYIEYAEMRQKEKKLIEEKQLKEINKKLDKKLNSDEKPKKVKIPLTEVIDSKLRDEQGKIFTIKIK